LSFSRYSSSIYALFSSIVAPPARRGEPRPDHRSVGTAPAPLSPGASVFSIFSLYFAYLCPALTEFRPHGEASPRCSVMQLSSRHSAGATLVSLLSVFSLYFSCIYAHFSRSSAPRTPGTSIPSFSVYISLTYTGSPRHSAPSRARRSRRVKSATYLSFE
jgi:hypothetical protein